MTQLSPTALEEAAKAISISTGDEPSKLTYAHEMQCTGRDREPQYRWQYWTEHATAAITAYLAQAEKEGWVIVPREPERVVIDRAVAFALNVSLTGDYNWSAYMSDLYRRMIHAAAQNGGE